MSELALLGHCLKADSAAAGLRKKGKAAAAAPIGVFAAAKTKSNP